MLCVLVLRSDVDGRLRTSANSGVGAKQGGRLRDVSCETRGKRTSQTEHPFEANTVLVRTLPQPHPQMVG